MSDDGQPGIRLSMPADLRHAALVRACLRDALEFRSDDAESSFLVAVTEIVVNSIEATAASTDRPDAPVIVEVWGEPDRHVAVRDSAGGLDGGHAKRDHLGAGLKIAKAFVSDLSVESDERGTSVRLGLGEAVG